MLASISTSTSRELRFAFFRLPLLVIVASMPALGLDPNLALTQYIHTSWTRGQTFSLPDIQALTQTPDGYLWLGTTNGLFRSDGIRFSEWQPLRSEKLPSNQIRVLRVAHDGALWIGSASGISRLERNHLVNYTVNNGFPQGGVLAILEDHSRRVWISVTDGKRSSLATIENGSITTHSISDGVRDPTVLALHEDSQNSLWIGTNHALGRWSANGGFLRLTSDRAAILSITDDGLGNVIATDRVTNAVLRVVDGKLNPLSRYDGAAALSPRALMRDRDGNVWLGTLGQGLFRLRGRRMERFTRRDGLSSDLIEAIFEDREGNLWIGTSNGLDRFRNPKAPRLTTLEGLSGDAVTAVCATRDGDIWIGTAGAGLNRLHGGEITVYSTHSGLPGSTIMSLHEDGAGLWIGTTGGLVYRSGGRFAEVRSANGAPLSRIFAMAGEGDNLWLLDEKEGLLKRQKGRFSAAVPDGVQIDTKDIYQIHSDERGALWIGFIHGGIAGIQGNTVTSYGPQDGLAPGPINAIQTDSSGTLWVGAGGGLSRLRKGHWTTWTQNQGVPEGGVQGIIEDKLGSLWLSNAISLMSVPMASLDSMPDGSPRALAGIVYGLSEGIRLPVNRGMVNPRLAASRDGHLWVATEDGAAVIDLKRLEANLLPPPVVVEQVSIDGHNLPIDSSTLVFRGRELKIEYTALSLVTPEKIHFRYKLEGFESAWRDATTERTVLYTNLSPRSYRFLVTACNNDGVWNNKGAALSFRVQTYFYQTYQFMALCMIAVALSGWGLHILRQRSLRARFNMILQERARLTRELHDTLLQGFAGVVYQLEAAWRQFDCAPGISRQRLQRAIEQADESLREARETLSFMRLSSIESGSLVEALELAGKKLTDGSSIRFETNVTGDIRQLRYDLEANLYILAREAMSNAVAHAGPRCIKLDMMYSPNSVHLAIKDDGSGFDPAAIHEDKQHFGLAGMRERAHQIGAGLTISSKIGSGTTIKVDLRDSRSLHVQ